MNTILTPHRQQRTKEMNDTQFEEGFYPYLYSENHCVLAAFVREFPSGKLLSRKDKFHDCEHLGIVANPSYNSSQHDSDCYSRGNISMILGDKALTE